jgi:hypothetical protein
VRPWQLLFLATDPVSYRMIDLIWMFTHPPHHGITKPNKIIDVLGGQQIKLLGGHLIVKMNHSITISGNTTHAFSVLIVKYAMLDQLHPYFLVLGYVRHIKACASRKMLLSRVAQATYQRCFAVTREKRKAYIGLFTNPSFLIYVASFIKGCEILEITQKPGHCVFSIKFM